VPGSDKLNQEGKDVSLPPAVSWISSEWLSDHLRDPGLIILDVRSNSHAYFLGHIPGAVWLHEAHLRSHIGPDPVRWIAADAAELLFSTLGIEQDKPVVVYCSAGKAGDPFAGGGDGLEQYLAAYTLARFGCRKVLLLDGGLDRWVREKCPLEREYGATRLSAFRAAVQTGFMVSTDECARMKEMPGVVLLDSRPPHWYEGQGPWMRPGHIPGAVNLPCQHLLTPDNPTEILPEEDLRKVLAFHDITPEKTVICSCGTGRTATVVFLILKWYLGYPDVVMYEDGFTRWSSLPDLPLVTGKNPR
jgi:thiosulfate/3-mercaptopyruvate sulfurtransferase